MSQQAAVVADNSPSLDLINQINDAFNSNDVSGIMPFFTDDACFNTTRGPGVEGSTYQGKKAIAEAFQALFDSVETVRWEPTDVRIAGDKVYCEYMRKARSKDGDETEWMTIDVISFRDGLITQKNSYTKVRNA
tara:strand:- start:161 stop:562 length:402 start_codon:yes stop_codon:yes gene_type:complete